jgi:hypothetical protein
MNGVICFAPLNDFSNRITGFMDLQDFFAKAKTGFTGFCFLKPRENTL